MLLASVKLLSSFFPVSSADQVIDSRYDFSTDPSGTRSMLRSSGENWLPALGPHSLDSHCVLHIPRLSAAWLTFFAKVAY